MRFLLQSVFSSIVRISCTGQGVTNSYVTVWSPVSPKKLSKAVEGGHLDHEKCHTLQTHRPWRCSSSKIGKSKNQSWKSTNGADQPLEKHCRNRLEI